MAPRASKSSADQHYGMLVLLTSQPPAVLLNLVHLVMHYQYGLEILVAAKPEDASPLHVEYDKAICCVIAIHDTQLEDRGQILSLNRRGRLPLILLTPASLLEAYKEACKGLKNVNLCSWESAFSHEDRSFHELTQELLGDFDIKGLLDNTARISPAVLQKRFHDRMRHLQVFPTLPEIIHRLTRILKNPKATIEDLEEVLIGDPAIVHRLLQVINTPVFAGTGHKGDWTLKESIVRLGLKKVGVIAQQVKLMNSLIKPQDSAFDLRAFWTHSLGTALIADRICSENKVQLHAKVPFNDYWMGALLHDIGKLVLGFFFWNHFEKIVSQMEKTSSSFRDAETILSEPVNHEYLSGLLVLNASGSPNLVKSVSSHHYPGKVPRPLAALVHLADNLCKDLDLGYLPEDGPSYSPDALRALQLAAADVEPLKAEIAPYVTSELEDMLNRCTQA